MSRPPNPYLTGWSVHGLDKPALYQCRFRSLPLSTGLGDQTLCGQRHHTRTARYHIFGKIAHTGCIINFSQDLHRAAAALAHIGTQCMAGQPVCICAERCFCQFKLEDAAAYLEGLINIEKLRDASERLSLEPIQALLARVGSPELELSPSDPEPLRA